MSEGTKGGGPRWMRGPWGWGVSAVGEAELQKVKTFTQAAFLGPKNLHQKCVIRDKFNATQSARFATNSIPKRLKKSVKQGNSVKHKETG